MNITNFEFNGFELRTIVDEKGEVFFVASDVAKSLDYRNASDMTRNLDEDEVRTHKMRTNAGDREMLLITEPGLYMAIMKSRKPEAKSFQKWVTSEVLPSIRKTGSYTLDLDDHHKVVEAYLEKSKALQIASQERDHAIKTKAQISDKKTATAMATASAKSRENAKLKIALGQSVDYLTIRAVEKYTGKKFPFQPLVAYCNAKGYEKMYAPSIDDFRHRMYPADAWLEVYAIDIKKIIVETFCQ